MKAINFLCIFILLVFSGYSELIEDNGFESGAGWTQYDGAHLEGWAARSGVNGLAFYGWESGGGAYCDISGGSGSNYVFSIWGLEDADFADGLSVEMKIELYTAGSFKLAEFSQTITGTTQWAQYTISAPSSPGTAVIRVVLAYSGTSGSDGAFKWDDAELTASSVSSYSDTHYVSPLGSAVYPYTNWATAAHTIYGAVAAANDGDEVVVGDGEYTEGYQIPVERAIYLHSVNGPDTCGINGGGAHRGLYITNPDAVIEGLAIRNCRALQEDDSCLGGGVYMPNGGTLRDCIVADNVVTGYVQGAPGNYLYCYGAGIYCANTARIERCAVYNNLAQKGESAGAGIFATNGVTITQCTVVSNRAEGGIISYYYGRGGYGSGIYAVNRVAIEDSQVCYNTATCQNSMYPGFSVGGGIYSIETGLVNRCRIFGNVLYGGGNSLRGYGGSRGAGVYVASGSVLKNSLLDNNKSLKTESVTTAYGAGVYAYGSSTRVLNCTIVDNYAEADPGGDSIGGGLYADNGVQIENCIIVSNTATADYGYRDCYVMTNCGITHCNIIGGRYPECSGGITEAPQFTDYSAGDFTLQYSSPCIDAGITTDSSADVCNMPRPLDGDNDSAAQIDLGAYEFVSDNADSDGDGMIDTHELLAGTDPTHALSVLAVRQENAAKWMPGSGITLHWPAVSGRKYTLLRAESLYSEFIPVATGIEPAALTNGFTDVSATNQTYFYRVQLETTVQSGE